MEYYAHSLPDLDRDHWQPLEEHLRQVASLAGQKARWFSGTQAAEICGLLHDLGKYSRDFQERLEGRRRHVDHKSYGAQVAAKLYGEIGRLLACAIAGHHGGLPDGANADGADLRSLLQRTDIPHCQPPQDLLQAQNPERLPLRLATGRMGFQLSFFLRMVYSALVDADFLDTERFMDQGRHGLRTPGEPLQTLHDRLLRHLDELQNRADPTPVNRKRREILAACLSSAAKEPGLFSLSVPTGGGKTLSSLAFALEHALRHGLRRIIYVIPYTSIIEQNAQVFRNVLGHDVVIEHHSNFTPDSLGRDLDEDSPEYKRARLAAENWDAPVVVTTNVQFFESLFASAPSRCRKLHNLARSVVILDEAQMLPVKHLRPCLEALRELASPVYGASIVLCTATQPNLSRPAFPGGLENVREMIPDPKALARDFERVRCADLGALSLQDLAQRLTDHEQALCIVNTRRRAAELFRLVHTQPGARHLSARMCPEHRSEVLHGIRADLAAGRPNLVVSTSLVEAGVDVSFPVVYRELAGLDSIAQAAGRCNREGEREYGETFVFRCEDGLPATFRMAADATETVLRQHGLAPFAPDVVRDFFAEYFWLKGEEELDEKRILHSLEEGLGRLEFPFASIAKRFRIIESDMLPVIVPWNEDGRRLVQELRMSEFPAAILRRLQRYTVQVHRHEFAHLENEGALELVQERYAALARDSFYDPGFGLLVDGEGWSFGDFQQ